MGESTVDNSAVIQRHILSKSLTTLLQIVCRAINPQVLSDSKWFQLPPPFFTMWTQKQDALNGLSQLPGEQPDRWREIVVESFGPTSEFVNLVSSYHRQPEPEANHLFINSGSAGLVLDWTKCNSLCHTTTQLKTVRIRAARCSRMNRDVYL